jgi:hypothetical protein
MMRRYGVSSAGIAIALALLCSCSTPSPPPPPPPVPPLIVGHAPAIPTGHLDTNFPVAQNGYAPFNQWPDSCELLTDKDIHAIFPQAIGKIVHKPQDEAISLLDQNSMPEQKSTVPDGICETDFTLPTDTTSFGSSTVTVTIEAAGDPDTVSMNYMPPVPNEAPMAESCIYRSGVLEYICGRVQVKVSNAAYFSLDETKDGKLFQRYQINGKVTSFAYATGQDVGQDAFENTHVTSEIAKAVLAKLPHSSQKRR